MDYQSLTRFPELNQEFDSSPIPPRGDQADTRQPRHRGEGVGQSAATVKVDGFSKTKNIDK